MGQGCSNHKDRKAVALAPSVQNNPVIQQPWPSAKARVANVLCRSCQCHLARLSYKLNSVLNTRREGSILPWLQTANSHKHRKGEHLVRISVLLI